MIGYKADPRRVHYWTYGETISVEELKKRPIWNTFSPEKKARLEAAAARGPEELKEFRALKAAYRAKIEAENKPEDKSE